MSHSTEIGFILRRIDNELPDLNESIKHILSEIYKSQMIFLDEQQQHDKCAHLSDLFNQLINMLNHDSNASTTQVNKSDNESDRILWDPTIR